MRFLALLQVVINNKRGGGFKKAKGKGSVVLKCEAGYAMLLVSGY